METNASWIVRPVAAAVTMGAVAEETTNMTSSLLWDVESETPLGGTVGGGDGGIGVGVRGHGSVGDDKDLTPLGLITVIVVAVVANLSVCIVVKVDRRLHHMTFYFFVSLALVHLLMAAAVMPLAVLVVLAGRFEYSEELCKLWVTMDLFFCNNTCLHLAFTNMDTFLRLKDPLRHGRVVTTCSIVLWIGAPWMISLVQAIAQFMLSQGDHGIVHGGICFIADKNFVILGTLFSFLIPTVIAILFYCLCVCEIRALKEGKYLEDHSEGSQNIYRYASNDSMADEVSDTTSCMSDTQCEQLSESGTLGGGGPGAVREQVQLAVVTSLKDSGRSDGLKDCILTGGGGGGGSGGGAGCHGGSPHNSSLEETTSFCEDNTLTSVENPSSGGGGGGRHAHHNSHHHHHNGGAAMVHITNNSSPGAHHQAGATGSSSNTQSTNFMDHILSTDQSASCTLLLREASTEGLMVGSGGLPPEVLMRPNAEVDHSSPDEHLRQEQAISHLMFLLLTCCVSLWVPFSAANVVYGVCLHCRQSMAFDEMSTFKWLAYSTAMLGPFIYAKFSEPMREAYWKLFSCSLCRTHRAH